LDARQASESPDAKSAAFDDFLSTCEDAATCNTLFDDSPLTRISMPSVSSGGHFVEQPALWIAS
jgi:hypothetical protein